MVVLMWNIDPQSFMLGVGLGVMVGLYIPDTLRWMVVSVRRWGKRGAAG